MNEEWFGAICASFILLILAWWLINIFEKPETREKIYNFLFVDPLGEPRCVYCSRKINWFSRRFNLETIENTDLLFTHTSNHWIFYIIDDRPPSLGKVNRAYALKFLLCPNCSKLSVAEKKPLFKKSYAIHAFFNLDCCDKCVSRNVKRIPVLDKNGFTKSARYICQDCGNSWGREF